MPARSVECTSRIALSISGIGPSGAPPGIASLAGTKDWIEGVVSGRDKEAILTAETTPEPPKTPQTSADHPWLYAGIAVLGLIAAAVASRIPGLRGRKR